MTQFLRKIFKPTLNIAILLVFIVIIAGSVVRMTGSGMGAPIGQSVLGITFRLPKLVN